MTLDMAQIGNINTIISVKTEDPELNSFLLTLGCYQGQEITVVTTISGSFTIAVLDSRYSIDNNLAKAILVK